MPTKKHLIIIHGRATKPSETEKQRLVRESLLHGLERKNPAAAKKIRRGTVKLSFAYYGDISNELMISAGKKDAGDLPDRDPAHGNARCEQSGSYDADLARLFARARHTKAAYEKLLKEEKDSRALDNVASAVSGVMNLLGLSDNVIRAATPDMGAYLTHHGFKSRIRERLNKSLLKALQANEDVCLVSHSMGCIVSYDVLWKYSHMSEYKGVRDKVVDKWITLGNPLGEPGVRDNLIDAPFDALEDQFPTNVRNWVNIAAYDDFVSHDGTMANDFENMRQERRIGGQKRAAVQSIRDMRIYNLWAGQDGSNPHKFYGYLDHPQVAAEIASWIG